MGYQLWISPNTGIRRKGTTFRELQDIFIDNITTRLIYEPLYCCKTHDNGIEVRQDMEFRDFDVVGVVGENGEITGYVSKDELVEAPTGGVLRHFQQNNIITDSTPVLGLLNILLDKHYSFVMHGNKVVGIVTRADINKPIVRIYLFGILSLFELHLNFWINEFYAKDTWQELLGKDRLEAIQEVYGLRQGQNEGLTLLECAQLADKKMILIETENFRNQFELSKGQTDQLIRRAERIRNELAHSQNSIISNMSWANFVSTVQAVEEFLHKSEQLVETKAKEVAGRNV